MKRCLLLLLLAVVTLGGSGCAFMSDEDRDFYGKGWVKPADLDKPMPHHVIVDPSQPQAEVAAAPSRTAPAQSSDPQWLIPEQGPQQ